MPSSVSRSLFHVWAGRMAGREDLQPVEEIEGEKSATCRGAEPADGNPAKLPARAMLDCWATW